MSIVNIRNALESALDAMQPALVTAHEGESYDPIIGTPYQQAFLLMATPRNPTMGDAFYQEAGIFQVTLNYPAGEGTVDAAARAEAIRARFKRGTSFTAGGTKVQIDETPSIKLGEESGGFLSTIVRAVWHADIYI